MAQTIKLKRGLSANLASLTLQAGEPAFATDTGKFYVGDGTDKILINPDQGTATNAETADKLTIARTINFTGDVTGSGSFDGSGNISIALTEGNTGVTAGTYSKVTVNAKGEVTAGATLGASDIPSLTLSKISDAGNAASKSVGTASGNVPVLDSNGKLDTAVLPGLALTTTNVVASQTAMLALTAEPGDLAVRTDLNKTFVLKTAGASTLANWQELLTPTDNVTSVAGKTGAVTLAKTDVGLGNVDNTSDANKPISTAVQTALDGKANNSHTHNYAGSSSAGGAATSALTCTGNSATASKLATARTIALTGAVTGSVNFDGSGNVSLATTFAATIDGGTF
ncbi:hyaluronate lyase N-terminal domain-containing protein [Clostridium butyricum]|uniref:hyaluronate lyase N-terminal domain-containing protein n=1 Tax=Clostridium butyricum TaxID=1492 RepID=UPI0025A3DECE|nr:hypothetical protein [Clostridium butyricum]MDM8130095.1 hypothetical protein [Clostridium butyricum]MDM8228222.1 hypothetical protein [Clostridium butyricum]